MSIEWKEIYNIGIAEIDEQHKKLVEIINEMFSEQKKGTLQIFMPEIFERLVDYTHYHFSLEEELFKKHDYPDSENHIKEHDEFKAIISSIKFDHTSGNIIATLKTIDYLKDWTITHILGTDKELALYLHSKGLS